MPRFVRPAYIRIRAEGIRTPIGTGPTERAGVLSAALTLRTPDGGVSDAITFDAGGKDDRGAGRLVIDIPDSFTVEDIGGGHIVVRPR